MQEGNMEMDTEKQVKRSPYSVRFDDEELEMLEDLRLIFGFSSQAQVLKRLVRTAHVRPASVKFAQPEAQQN
jgi:hypothetical protein